MDSPNVAIFGSLPDDLLEAGATHKITADLSNVVWGSDGRSVELSLGSRITFTDMEGRQQWTTGLRPMSISTVQPFDKNSSSNDKLDKTVSAFDPKTPCAMIDPASWVRAEVMQPLGKAAYNVLLPKGTTPGHDSVAAHQSVTLLTASDRDTVDTPSCATAAVAQTPQTEMHLQGCTLSDLLASPAHRRLVDEIVFFLAPARRTVGQLLTHLFTSSAVAAEMRAGYSMADVQHVLTLLTGASLAAGQAGLAAPLELNAQGFALVAMERYDSKRSKQLVANRAFAVLAQESAAVPAAERAALLHALELYVDRDVVLAVRSGGGGIMAGLSSLKRARPESDLSTRDAALADVEDNRERGGEEEDDGSEVRDKGSGGGGVEVSETTRRLRVTEMSQCDIAWAEADLGALAVGRFMPDTRDALGAVRCWYKSAPPTAMPITSSASLRMGQHFYAQLLPRHATLRAALERHAEVLRQGRVWCEAYLAERGTPELRRQLRQWLALQRAHREPLVALYGSLQHTLYTLERDLTDYVHLHEFGVL